MLIKDKMEEIMYKEERKIKLSPDEKIIKFMKEVLFNIEMDMITFSEEYKSDKLFNRINKELEKLVENIE